MKHIVHRTSIPGYHWAVVGMRDGHRSFMALELHVGLFRIFFRQADKPVLTITNREYRYWAENIGRYTIKPPKRKR